MTPELQTVHVDEVDGAVALVLTGIAHWSTLNTDAPVADGIRQCDVLFESDFSCHYFRASSTDSLTSTLKIT